MNGQTYYYKLADVDLAGRLTWHGPVEVKVQTDETSPFAVNEKTPTSFFLHPNYPNPFNPSTTIVFDVPPTNDESVNVELAIYNLSGQKIRTLVNDQVESGKQYRLSWDGRDGVQIDAPAGIYFAVLRSSNFQQTIKMCLIR
ncbi:MAG: T9SS type A sorting domain-containing protein [Calditrichaeota bacterium]|nr:T9SS type A sorting domain-containing protein [Calditrichota bacterium]